MPYSPRELSTVLRCATLLARALLRPSFRHFASSARLMRSAYSNLIGSKLSFDTYTNLEHCREQRSRIHIKAQSQTRNNNKKRMAHTGNELLQNKREVGVTVVGVTVEVSGSE